MADALTEWAKNEKDEITKGIFTNILTYDSLMPFLRFESFEGNAKKYQRENAIPSSGPHGIGGTWQSTRPTFTQKTATLTTIGTQTDMDMYIADTRGSVQSPEDINMALMTKSLVRELSRQFIQGDVGTISTDIDGITSLVVSDSRFLGMDNLATALSATPGSAETTLTLAGVDLLIDQLADGSEDPSMLLMNTTIRRKLTALARASGSGVVLDNADMFGHRFKMYNAIPMVMTNYITNAEQYEAAGTWPSSTATTIYAVQFGKEKEGHVLIHNGPVMQPRVRDLGIARDEEVKTWRMLVYTQALLYSALHIAGLGGIDSAT